MDEIDSPRITEDQSDELSNKTKELEKNKRLLFDDDFIPEGYDPENPMYVVMFNPVNRKLTGRNRALLTWDHMPMVLPGGGRYMTDYPVGEHSAREFMHDFSAVAEELGIDLDEVRRLNDPARLTQEIFPIEEAEGLVKDPHLELFQYVYPIMEKLVLEKDYPTWF